jgi:purine-binding chemotaxis protein CheW
MGSMSDSQAVPLSSVAGKYLAFALSKERYGLEILKVQEIIKVAHITSVPKCPSYIKGVINLRGKIIPVIDLRMKFGIEPIPYDDKTCIIVINITKGEQRIAIGIIVDTVLEVINFTASEIEPAPQYGSHLHSHFVIGMGKKMDHLNILIDIERVITETDSATAASLTE